jgi:hypothetical protein
LEIVCWEGQNFQRIEVVAPKEEEEEEEEEEEGEEEEVSNITWYKCSLYCLLAYNVTQKLRTLQLKKTYVQAIEVSM